MMLLAQLEAMLGGPGRLRLIVQPLVAILLGIRDGRLDAAAGRAPYAFAVLFARERRKEALLSGLRTLIKPLTLAILIDMLVQYFIFRHVRLWEALLVGTGLVALPYVAARGITNRVTRRRPAPPPHHHPPAPGAPSSGPAP
jgi:hypothetical protein